MNMRRRKRLIYTREMVRQKDGGRTWVYSLNVLLRYTRFAHHTRFRSHHG